jgi:hypothetical protein
MYGITSAAFILSPALLCSEISFFYSWGLIQIKLLRSALSLNDNDMLLLGGGKTGKLASLLQGCGEG